MPSQFLGPVLNHPYQPTEENEDQVHEPSSQSSKNENSILIHWKTRWSDRWRDSMEGRRKVRATLFTFLFRLILSYPRDAGTKSLTHAPTSSPTSAGAVQDSNENSGDSELIDSSISRRGASPPASTEGVILSQFLPVIGSVLTTYDGQTHDLLFAASSLIIFGESGECPGEDGPGCTRLECDFSNSSYQQCNLSRVAGFSIPLAWSWSDGRCSGGHW